MKGTGIADTAYFGPEAEFFVFDKVMYSAGEYSAAYQVDSVEGPWNNGIFGFGHSVPHKRGYFPVPPLDTCKICARRWCATMIDAGVPIELHHHEVGTAGQCEIDMRTTLVKMADNVQIYKYIVKNVAQKPRQDGHLHAQADLRRQRLRHAHPPEPVEGRPAAVRDATGYAGLSQMALWYIGGLLKHINALLAICAPTTNSYRRLVPGYEAPVVIAYSARNRSAACAHPHVLQRSPKAKRVEFRCPDPAANPYLAFAACLMAGLDGIKNQIDPGEPAEMDLFDAENINKVKMTVGKLNEALDALAADHDFLLEGGVFTPDVLDAFAKYKHETEIGPVALRPHPYEFLLYYNS
jgi:glutamine synthetase